MAKGTDGIRRNAATGESYLPHQEPRYREIASFMRAPLAESLEELDIALVGIPFDGGVSNRPGARHGPREIRNQSSMMRRHVLPTSGMCAFHRSTTLSRSLMILPLITQPFAEQG